MEVNNLIVGKSKLAPPLAYLLLILIYISTFRVFATLPLENLHQVLSSAAIVVFTLYYLFNLFFRIGKSKITKIDLILWVFILVNLIAVYKANIIFGQPYYFGILAQMSILLSFSGILIISFLINGLITIQQVEKTFLITSISLLLTCYIFFLLVSPDLFKDDNFLAYNPIRGFRFRFQFALIVMLFFYSIFKVLNERNMKYSVIIVLIIFYLIYFLQSRISIVVVLLTLLIYFYRNFSLKEKFRGIIIYGSLLLIGAVVLFSLGYTGVFEKYKLLFSNVLDAFISKSTSEPSSAVRYMELQNALEYIEKNPLFGNGFISNQWKDGWRGIFGYFYPEDIGIVGNVFVFGIIGTILIYLPFYFSYQFSRKVKSQNVFYKTCEYMQLYFFLNMFVSAINMRDSGSIMLLVCLIYYFRYYYFPVESNRDPKPVIPAVL